VKQKSKLRYLAEYFVFRTIVCLIDAVPVRTATRFAEMFAFVVVDVLPRKLSRYNVARENIRTAFGSSLTERRVHDMILRMWVHLFRIVVEIVQITRKLRLYNCADIIDFRHRDETVRTMCTGRPVLALSGHFGNWEMAISTFGMFGFPLGVVARDLDNPYLHEWFRRFREFTGHRLISKKGGGNEMVDFLERRGHLGLLADQDAGSRGMFVPFFGKDASTFKSIALLALQHRAYICVGYAYRLADDWQNHRWVRYQLGTEAIIDTTAIDGADPVREITELYTLALERAIRRAPEQYFWVHRRWKSKPAERRRGKKAA